MSKPTKSKCRIFVKFMSSEHVKSFVDDGLLFMNTVGYFREVEDDLRGDKLDGLTSRFNPNTTTIHFDGHEVGGITGIEYKSDHESDTNLFCLTAIYDEDLLQSHGELYLSDKFIKFGDKAIVIAGDNIVTFLDLVKDALEKDKNIIDHPEQENDAKSVDYVCKKSYYGNMGIFRKFDDYAWQHEWRIAIKQTLKPGKAYGFNIGSIKDICTVFDTSTLISQPITMKGY